MGAAGLSSLSCSVFISLLFLLSFLIDPAYSKLSGQTGTPAPKKSPRPLTTTSVTKFRDRIVTRYQTMIEYSKREPLINFVSPQEFKEYIVRSPKNYSVLVLFNSEHTGCLVCSQLHELLEHVAMEYGEKFQSSNEGQPIFFVELLRNEVPKVFDWLKIKRIPELMVFGEEGRFLNVTLFDHDRYNIRNGMHVFEWIQSIMKHKVPEGDHSSGDDVWAMLINAVALASVIGAAFLHRDFLLAALTDMTVMAYVGLAIFSILIGGHIFNHIEDPDFFGTNSQGSYVLFARSMNYQFQAEAFIITTIYAFASLGCLGVIEGRRLVLKGQEGGVCLSAAALLASAISFLTLIGCSASKL